MTRPPLMPMKPLPPPVAFVLAASLVAVGSSCSSQGGATYERGTLTRPPPAQQRPGVGAPIVGQPGRAQPNVQPNPTYSRPLPPSKEPGLWSSKEPVASTDAEPTFAGVLFPHPGAAEEYGVRDKILKCSKSLSGALDPVGITARVKQLKPGARYRCMVAHLFHACAKFLNDRVLERPNLPAQDVQEYTAMLGIAATFLELECVDVELTDEMILLRNEAGRKWTEYVKKTGLHTR